VGWDMRETLVKIEDFKDSPLGKIPEGWEVKPLREIADLQVGFAFKSEWFQEHEGIRLLRGENVGYGSPDWSETRRLPWKMCPNYQEYELVAGDIIIGMDRTFTKSGFKISVLEPDDVPALLVQRVGRFIPINCDHQFLKVLLNSQEYHHALLAQQKGMDIPHLSKTEILEPVVAVPPVDEQRQIAEILNTIDSTIAHTSSLIAKLKLMKAGLLHDLLTRGLDENGELRDAIAYPEQFKDSPLGRIPKDWKIYNTGAIATIKYGINDAVDQTLESGVLTITLPCVSKTGELTLHKELLALSARHKVRDEDILQAGDLLFNWRNGSQEHLGKTAYFKATGEYTHVGFLLRIRANSELCDSRYLWWRISYMKSEGLFLRAKSQVNNTFNSEELANMRVIVPPIPEQQRIVKALEPCEQRIRAEEAYRDKLKLQKQGLMHDLLTGKVRVKDADKFTSASHTV